MNGPYASSYPVSSESIGDGMIEIQSEAISTIHSPESPGSSQLGCQGLGENENGIVRFGATSAGNIPEENVPVDGAE